MGAVLFDSRDLVSKWKEDLKEKAREFLKSKGREPRLVAVMTENDSASELFVKKKMEFGKEIGVMVGKKDWFEKSIDDFRGGLSKLSEDDGVDGIFCQLPLRPDLRERQQELLDVIGSEKDVDCLTSVNLTRFEKGGGLEPAVMKAVGWTLEEIKKGIEISFDDQVVVFGAKGYMGSLIVKGLKNRSYQKILEVDEDDFDLKREGIIGSKVLISCVGKPGLIKDDLVAEGMVLIDVGTTLVGGEVKGDVDFSSVEEKAGLVTKVPGGVGPLTVVGLFYNLLEFSDGEDRKN